MIGRFVLRRLGIAVLQLLGVALAVFFLIRLLPADPVARLVGSMPARRHTPRQSAPSVSTGPSSISC